MKTFPYEVLRNIGLFLNQVDQKACSIVCKLWLNPFRDLVFQKVVLLKPDQLQNYNEQDPSLKRLTQSLHFNVPLTDQLLIDFAEASPNVHTLTLFVNLLNNLSIPKTVSVISTYWLKSLTKIRMDGLLLPEVLPLLCHQLEDVTGDWRGFYTKDKQIIPMPKLKILDIEDDYSVNERMLSAKLLDSMRIAYPKLQKLTVGYFFVGIEHEDIDEAVDYKPFPLVKSFHILNCDELEDAYPSLRKTFTDLKEFSLLRSTPQGDEEFRHISYSDLVVDHPNIQHLKIDHLNTDSIGLYNIISKLKHLTSLHLELSGETGVITKRYRIELPDILSRLPNIKKLKIWGLSHIGTGETLEHYLCGTVGYFDGDHEDDEDEPPESSERERFSGVTYDSDVFVGDHPFFGNGEQLMNKGHRELVVKKHFPFDQRWPIYQGLTFATKHIGEVINPYKLTSLYLEMSTLRNPTYHWLTRYCPLLEELFVLQSEPYPYFVINLGEKLHTFTWSFDERYAKYEPPSFICMNGVHFLEYVTPYLGYQESEEARHIIQTNDASFKIDLNFGPSLKNLKICGQSLLVYK